MLRYENAAASVDLDGLLATAAALQELTSHVNDLKHVPEVLAKATQLELVTFALLAEVPDHEPQILVLSSCGEVGGSANLQTDPGLQQELLSTIRAEASKGMTPPEDAAGTPCLVSHYCDDKESATCPRCRQVVITRQIDGTHRMILIVRQRPEAPAVPQATIDVLHLLSNYLSKTLRTMLSCYAYPPRLGEPFTKMTEREWMVLCGLDSEDGEKQLADRLGLSPHTLHSHIKSIYRKIGVQGRLPLQQRFRKALQECRVRGLAMPVSQGCATSTERVAS